MAIFRHFYQFQAIFVTFFQKHLVQRNIYPNILEHATKPQGNSLTPTDSNKITPTTAYIQSGSSINSTEAVTPKFDKKGKLYKNSKMYRYIPSTWYDKNPGRVPTENEIIHDQVLKEDMKHEFSMKTYRQNTVLDHVMRSSDQKLLKHPLVLQLLEIKWKAYGLWLYFQDLFIYMLFLTVLCVYALSLPSPHAFMKISNPNVSNCWVLKPEVELAVGYRLFENLSRKII